VIAVRAGAARLRQDPERSHAALEAIEELARRTAGELDHLVGTLRGGPPDGGVEAPPGLASLDTLIEHHAEAGLAVTVARAGEPRTLSGAGDQAAYRIIQEALSNAARHGSGGAHIALEYAETALALTVINPVAPGATPRPGGGHGLIGMRERATLLGGELDAGRVNGTFRLRATIPYRGDYP
jgi:signal transduction histidine kinase